MAVEFDLPDGFQMPDDVQEGQTFDALASLKMADDGKVQLVSLDGMPVDGGEGDEGGEGEESDRTKGAGGGQQTPKGQGGMQSFEDAVG